MNSIAIMIGYVIMTISGFAFTIAAIWGLVIVIGYIPIFEPKVLQILRLGMKAYMELPKEKRKGWKQ